MRRTLRKGFLAVLVVSLEFRSTLRERSLISMMHLVVICIRRKQLASTLMVKPLKRSSQPSHLLTAEEAASPFFVDHVHHMFVLHLVRYLLMSLKLFYIARIDHRIVIAIVGWI